MIKYTQVNDIQIINVPISILFTERFEWSTLSLKHDFNRSFISHFSEIFICYFKARLSFQESRIMNFRCRWKFFSSLSNLNWKWDLYEGHNLFVSKSWIFSFRSICFWITTKLLQQLFVRPVCVIKNLFIFCETMNSVH